VSMSHVALIQAAHDAIKAYGLGNARNGGKAFRISLPLSAEAGVDPNELLKMLLWLEFVHWANWDDEARVFHIECLSEAEIVEALHLFELSRGVPRESMPSGSRWGIGPIYGLIDPDAVRRD
jgi:hypothetical protein